MLLKVFLLLVFTSCATYQPGEKAEVVSGDHNKKMPITAWEDSEMNSDHFRVVQFSFGNQDTDWIRIKEIELLLEEDKKIYITIGKDLLTWRESTLQKMNVDRFNSQMLWGGVAVAGVGLSLSAGSRGEAPTIGSTMALGSIGIMAGKDLAAQVRDLNKGGQIPEGHILAPFSVAPGLVTKRWLVLQTPKDYELKNVKFRLKYLDGKVADYDILLRL